MKASKQPKRSMEQPKKSLELEKPNVLVDVDIDEKIIEEIDISGLFDKKLVVHNDDHNTFSHVIMTLVSACGHSTSQAEQCAYLIHRKGKCSLKEGGYEYLKPIKTKITDEGIRATIE